MELGADDKETAKRVPLRDRPFSELVPEKLQRRRYAAYRRKRRPRTKHWSRRLTGPLRGLPDFLVIGAQKCGTTSLYHYFKQHPEMAAAANKEPGYFFRGAGRVPLSHYRRYFPLRPPFGPRGRLNYEATPEYIYFPHVPLRVRELDRDMRFIAILRDPVSRAVSHYGHLLSHQHVRQPIERFLELAPDADEGYVVSRDDPLGWGFSRPAYDIVARGIYHVQLARWFDTFGRDAVHVVFLEDLKADAPAVMTGICEFLHVAPFAFDTSRARYAGLKLEPSPEVTERLRARFAGPNARLAELLGRDLPWR